MVCSGRSRPWTSRTCPCAGAELGSARPPGCTAPLRDAATERSDDHRGRERFPPRRYERPSHRLASRGGGQYPVEQRYTVRSPCPDRAGPGHWPPVPSADERDDSGLQLLQHPASDPGYRGATRHGASRLRYRAVGAAPSRSPFRTAREWRRSISIRRRWGGKGSLSSSGGLDSKDHSISTCIRPTSGTPSSRSSSSRSG